MPLVTKTAKWLGWLHSPTTGNGGSLLDHEQQEHQWSEKFLKINVYLVLTWFIFSSLLYMTNSEHPVTHLLWWDMGCILWVWRGCITSLGILKMNIKCFHNSLLIKIPIWGNRAFVMNQGSDLCKYLSSVSYFLVCFVSLWQTGVPYGSMPLVTKAAKWLGWLYSPTAGNGGSLLDCEQ